MALVSELVGGTVRRRYCISSVLLLLPLLDGVDFSHSNSRGGRKSAAAATAAAGGGWGCIERPSHIHLSRPRRAKAHPPKSGNGSWRRRWRLYPLFSLFSDPPPSAAVPPSPSPGGTTRYLFLSIYLSIPLPLSFLLFSRPPTLDSTTRTGPFLAPPPFLPATGLRTLLLLLRG